MTPKCSQWPVVESLPAERSAILPNAAEALMSPDTPRMGVILPRPSFFQMGDGQTAHRLGGVGQRGRPGVAVGGRIREGSDAAGVEDNKKARMNRFIRAKLTSVDRDVKGITCPQD